MQTQIVFKAGNSDVIAIPKHLSKESGIKAGQKITVTVTNDGLLIRKLEGQEPKTTVATKEFKKWLDNVLKEDAEILDELSDR